MHPYLIAAVAAEHAADLRRDAEAHRRAASIGFAPRDRRLLWPASLTARIERIRAPRVTVAAACCPA